MPKSSSNRRFCAAISKSGKIFIGNGSKGVKRQIKNARTAGHNVIMFSCAQKGGDGKLIIKQLGRAKFRIGGFQRNNLRKACVCFFKLKT